MAVTSDQIWYPAGGDGPAYDLRKITVWHEKPGDSTKVLARLDLEEDPEYGEGSAVLVEFDKTAFEAAKQQSADNEPSGPSGAFEPDSLSGLWAWYDAADTDTVTDDGDTLTISDKSGVLGSPLEGSLNNLAYGDHLINGENTASTTGDGGACEVHPDGGALARGTRRIVFFVGERLTQPGADGFVLPGTSSVLVYPADGSAEQRFQHDGLEEDSSEFGHFNGASTEVFGELSSPYLLTAEYTNDSQDVDIYINNVFWISRTGGDTIDLEDGWAVIRQASNAPELAFAEHIEYNTDEGLDWTIGDPEYDEVVAYLSDKWGLELA